MEYDDKSRWMFMRRDDIEVVRAAEPIRLDVNDAVSWIQEHRPTPWIGSVFSLPQPSALPPGTQVSRLLFDALCPPTSSDDAEREEVFRNQFLPRWPLERLFDLCDSLSLSVKETVLNWFADAEKTAKPNALHFAIAKYCKDSSIAQCVTTNWDSLLEDALAAIGLPPKTAGVDDGFDKNAGTGSGIRVHHPHGSFSQGDVVCSLRTEARGVQMPFPEDGQAFMFLGYSGYEPSMYPCLELTGSTNAIWCVRDPSELSLPLKRRLLSLLQTVVYVGDLRTLLAELGLLAEDVSLGTDSGRIQLDVSPEQSAITGDVIRASLGKCDLKEAFNAVGAAMQRSEAEFFMRAVHFSDLVGSLVRSRHKDPLLEQVIVSVLKTAPPMLHHFHLFDQFWLWHIAYSLRNGRDLSALQIDQLNRIAARSDLYERAGFAGACVKLQAIVYGSVLIPHFSDALDEGHYVTASGLGDQALHAELAELYGWDTLRRNDRSRAEAFFDAAATKYFLSGINAAAEFCLDVRHAIRSGRAAHPSALELE